MIRPPAAPARAATTRREERTHDPEGPGLHRRSWGKRLHQRVGEVRAAPGPGSLPARHPRRRADGAGRRRLRAVVVLHLPGGAGRQSGGGRPALLHDRADGRRQPGDRPAERRHGRHPGRRPQRAGAVRLERLLGGAHQPPRAARRGAAPRQRPEPGAAQLLRALRGAGAGAALRLAGHAAPGAARHHRRGDGGGGAGQPVARPAQPARLHVRPHPDPGTVSAIPHGGVSVSRPRLLPGDRRRLRRRRDVGRARPRPAPRSGLHHGHRGRAPLPGRRHSEPPRFLQDRPQLRRPARLRHGRRDAAGHGFRADLRLLYVRRHAAARGARLLPRRRVA